jgi:hypothetical protein
MTSDAASWNQYRKLFKTLNLKLENFKWQPCLFVIPCPNKGHQMAFTAIGILVYSVLKNFYKSLCTLHQWDNFSAKTLERNNIWVHPFKPEVNNTGPGLEYEQLKLILTQICQVRTPFGSDYKLLLAHTFCILYSLYPRFSVLQLAWFIHDVAFWNTVYTVCIQKKALKWKWQIPSASFHTARKTLLYFKH